MNAPALPLFRRRALSIRTRLLLLVFAAWLPAAAAFGLFAWQTYLRETDAAKQQVQQIALGLNQETEQILATGAVIAKTLASSAMLDRQDWAAFHAEASAAVRDTGGWVLVQSAEQQLLNTRVPYAHDQPVPRLQPGRLVEGAPEVRFVLRSPRSDEPVVGVFAPDRLPRPRFNVGFGFPAARLQTLVGGRSIPQGAVAALMDQQQRVVARSRDPLKWMGRSATGEVQRRAVHGDGGFVESVTLDGVASLTYITPPNRYGWATVIALPMASLAESADRLTWQAVAAASMWLGAGLAFALLLARRITRPVLHLRDAAAALAEDRVPALQGTGVVEADAVLAALHRAGQQSLRAKEELRVQVDSAVAQAQQAQTALLDAHKHEAIGRLAGGIAHDFNNLLQTINAGVQLALRGKTIDPRAERALESAMRASGKAARLVRLMLTFGRSEQLAPQPIRLTDWLLGHEELLQKAVHANVRLAADVEPGLPPLLVDPTHFELALLNLIFNARDAMPEGGALTVSARPATAAQVASLAEGRYAALVVADEGHGMDAYVLAQATEPYFTTKPVGQGSGLGLAQVKAFASRSGGAFALASQPGKGTQATLVLPTAGAALAPDESRAVPAPADTAAPASRSLNVLMVEDDALAASVVVPAIELAGHQVRAVGSADLAAELLEGHEHFDVLFTDIVMPGRMNGLDLVRWARQRRPGLPVIVATGFTAEPLDADLVVLRKPYQVDELLTALQRAAERGGSAG